MVTLQCNVKIANIMSEANHRSELLTQCLMYDRAEWLGEDGAWIRIRLRFNQTEGWVLKSQFETIQSTEFEGPIKMIQSISMNEMNKWLPGTCFFDDHIISPEVVDINTLKLDATTIRDIACSFLDSPYMWGGISAYGIDCSGLSQIVYRFFNIPLTSFAAEQFKQGEVLDFLQDAKCGDLAFFEEEDGSITHVGILLSPSEIIHATEKAGRVVIDSMDQEGIISKRDGKRTHRLRIVKRLF